ncbi:annexin B11-like isoform X2 [Thrips palmi]|uniref:Annexin n=1 Tax=Thrips palmi TaxID=161013 RepID=A0A6P8Y2G4_THRPL|nr:annexin B11-like isoform X2 [Thrips palmi]XP_034230491.1 annexin B11-like isoform X2 [Thrips palmi]XP_034230492.1 annexin B11-like isoform X2 [Thrips palmi]
MSYPGYPSQGYGNPTVHPVQPFDPRSDAEVLRKAMKGFGTDEKAIINVLARRSNTQRQEILLQFKTLYGKDLISNLKSELSGKFEDLVIALMKPHYEFMAKEIHDALAGIGTDEETVIEVVCSATNGEIHAIKSVYQNMYGRSLEGDLKGDTSGNFKRLMVSLCMGNRSEDYNVDPAAAQADAQALLRAGELRAGTDESAFNAVICQRSYPQLQAVMQEYQRITGHSLLKAVKHEFSGDIEEGLMTILKCVENRPAYFAERLYKSMKGLGTDDRSLIRLVVSRCEVDMGDIKTAFEAAYGKTLASFISGDCSGHYEKCLLALIGEY